MRRDNQTDVTILGLGAMGSAFASVFLKAGKRITVWNRSPDRADPLVRQGAVLAPNVEAAMTASPVTVMIVLDHIAVEDMLSDQVLAASEHRTLVNLTTATSTEVKDLAEKCRNARVRYLAGGVTVYPQAIGDNDTVIFYSGDRMAFDEYGSLLKILAGSQKFVGSDPAVGQAMYLATAGACFSAVPGIFEAVAWGERYGIPVTQTFEYIQTVSVPYLREVVQEYSRRLAIGDQSGDHGAVDTFALGLEAANSELKKLNIGSRSFGALNDYLKIAQKHGHGNKDFSSLYNIILNNKNL